MVLSGTADKLEEDERTSEKPDPEAMMKDNIFARKGEAKPAPHDLDLQPGGSHSPDEPWVLTDEEIEEIRQTILVRATGRQSESFGANETAEGPRPAGSLLDFALVRAGAASAASRPPKQDECGDGASLSDPPPQAVSAEEHHLPSPKGRIDPLLIGIVATFLAMIAVVWWVTSGESEPQQLNNSSKSEFRPKFESVYGAKEDFSPKTQIAETLPSF
ncbi:MAG: hypothetical protein R3245_05215, partial [Kiloniellales bacterium]|nr:hypothetical protein [Kiloniellales bacterium]